MKKSVCVVTGSRAEYGLLRWAMEEIQASSSLELRVIVTGAHLSPEFGMTASEIESDGFAIDQRVEMLLSADTPTAITKSIGLGLIGFADALAIVKPDLLLVLGDRYEILAAVIAALVARVPVAHVHGGETTQGAIDEAIRHSITKMSQLHFVAAQEYRNRVIQLGEEPSRVFCVGGLGIDGILKTKRLSRAALEESLGIKFLDRNLMVTFHPATLETDTAETQMDELLAALADLQNTAIVFTMPNADTDGRALLEKIKVFCEQHANSHWFSSLGHARYLSCLAQVDAVVGNSSSGLTEAPTFKVATVNIGDRQLGRLSAQSVIDCSPTRESIADALATVYSPDFRTKLLAVVNPYGDGGAASAIVQMLERCVGNITLKKPFHDLPSQNSFA
jgi:GDP/UDP-N,N'-diacetylbacillosamine 2-epimerase (hydrolysing)